MIRELFGANTRFATLRDGLDAATAAQRRIANRVANATNGAFSTELAKAQGGSSANAADLERSMTQLADTQIRFDATARLLQKAYAGIRTAIKNG